MFHMLQHCPEGMHEYMLRYLLEQQLQLLIQRFDACLMQCCRVCDFPVPGFPVNKKNRFQSLVWHLLYREASISRTIDCKNANTASCCPCNVSYEDIQLRPRFDKAGRLLEGRRTSLRTKT